ncbi:GNAT family N-acetyltransferase [Nocardioides sp. YIM 152315]|uniref:GNAT family N-acetyltransferase n=1 Tax=Nocardioides sp. YIM 152315 TaxID=3031760 RepID=UPI0023DA4B14|nr:GNAT family N-acetyltransferase [Nocardioides sp. YIM 152315]MDF1605529.1 GNAT family N-acetyltransferase [Nocardioides sp. YIM 152315]
MVLVRTALPDDIVDIAAIYDDEVQHGISTFATEPPGPDYWHERLSSTHPGDHVLAAERDGVVIGYAYSSSYRPRAAYRHTRETSIYLAAGARGSGIGRALYDELLSRLRAGGVRTVVAVVALPNPGSQALHRACGFERAGVLHDVGRKFDRWIDTELWERRLTVSGDR